MSCGCIQAAETIAASKPKAMQVIAWSRQETKVTGAGIMGLSPHLPGRQAQPEKALTLQSADMSVSPLGIELIAIGDAHDLAGIAVMRLDAGRGAAQP